MPVFRILVPVLRTFMPVLRILCLFLPLFLLAEFWYVFFAEYLRLTWLVPAL